MDTSLALLGLTAAAGVTGTAWFFFAPLRGLFARARVGARPQLPCCLALALGAAGCGGSGLPEKLPAHSAASPSAASAPSQPVARALRQADPLAWPPADAAGSAGHSDHAGHTTAAPGSTAPASDPHAHHRHHAAPAADPHAGHAAPGSAPASAPASAPSTEGAAEAGVSNPHQHHHH